jgi:hypothetical protein
MPEGQNTGSLGSGPVGSERRVEYNSASGLNTQYLGLLAYPSYIVFANIASLFLVRAVGRLKRARGHRNITQGVKILFSMGFYI